MTAAVPLIHAFTPAVVTGIMVEQTGESEGNRGGDVGEKHREEEKEAKDCPQRESARIEICYVTTDHVNI